MSPAPLSGDRGAAASWMPWGSRWAARGTRNGLESGFLLPGGEEGPLCLACVPLDGARQAED